MSLTDKSRRLPGDAAWQDLMDAAARCPHATVRPDEQALQNGLGVAFYQTRMTDPEHRLHVEARTYGGPAADFSGACPSSHSRSRAHETLVRLVAAFRHSPDGTLREDPLVLLEIGRSLSVSSEREQLVRRAVEFMAGHDPDDPLLPKAYDTLADTYVALGDAERSQAMGRATVEFHRRAVDRDPQRYAADLTAALCRHSGLTVRYERWEESLTVTIEALARIRLLHEGLADHELVAAPFFAERIQLASRAARALRDHPADASELFREALRLYGKHVAVLGVSDDDDDDDDVIREELYACLRDHDPLLPGGEPLGTLVIHDIGGVLFVEDVAEREQREAYTEGVESARTYGQARAAGAPVDDLDLCEDYYVDLYLEAHNESDPDEMREELRNLDPEERRQRVRPLDEALFDLEGHPMYQEGEWWPLPDNDGPWLGDDFPSEPIDNGGRVSSIEGWSPDDEDAIILYLLLGGWAVRRYG